MLPPQFIPSLNGGHRAIFEHLDGVGPRGFARLSCRARQAVMESLPGEYYGAVDIYRLDYHLERWSAATAAEQFGRQAGQLYLILDYFNARLFPPRLHEGQRASRTAALASYFWQRSADNLEANTTGLLTALAIAVLLPDEWFPQIALQRRIQAEIGRLRVYEEAQVSGDLGLPPGGVRWMGQATLAALSALQAKLAAGGPCLARMIRDPRRLNANRQVIVYDCVALHGQHLRLSIYEPDCLCYEHGIQADLSGEVPVLVETCSQDEPMPVFGLLSENYTPANLPKAGIPPWLRNWSIRSWYWRLRYRLYQAGIFSASH